MSAKPLKRTVLEGAWDAKERAAHSEIRSNALTRAFPGPRANFLMIATRHSARRRTAGKAFEAEAWKEAKEAFEQVGIGQPVSLFFTYDFASMAYLRSAADREAWTARLQNYHARVVAEMDKPEHATTRAGLQHFLGLAHLPSQPGLFAGSHVEFWPLGGKLGLEGIRAVQDGSSTTLAVGADRLGEHFEQLRRILQNARPGL